MESANCPHESIGLSINKEEICTELLRSEWHPVKVEQKTFPLKCSFGSDSIELLVLDFSKLELFHANQQKQEILDIFNVILLRNDFKRKDISNFMNQKCSCIIK